MGIIAFVIFILWRLGDLAESYRRTYGYFDCRRFYISHKLLIGQETGLAVLVAVGVEVLLK